jgi:UDP-N-acetylmuramate--alanine ligase
LVHNGKTVSGTNDVESPATLNELLDKGVVISYDVQPKSLPEADAYIYSDAWTIKNKDLLDEAKRRGKPVVSYFEALGLISRQYKVVAIAGTHGKTTTTAMCADIFEAAGLSPTVVVGSLRQKTGSNFQAGTSEWFIVEADEYLRHFLHFEPYVLAIINIDLDHLEYYKDLADIQSAFRSLANKVPAEGFIVCDPSQKTVGPVVGGAMAKIIDYQVKNSVVPEMKLPGQQYKIDAAVAMAVGEAVGIRDDQAIEALKNFSGTARRFDFKGQTKTGTKIYEDFAHHPAEVKITLEGARSLFKKEKMVVVFQPHLYSRTKMLLADFGKSFNSADLVVVCPIYAARELPDISINHQMLAEEINKNGVNVLVVDSLDEAKNAVLREVGPDDVVMTVGAGDIAKLSNDLTK